MAEKITVYQCPACTGPLQFDGKLGKLKCEYCGSTYSVEEVNAFYDAKNKAASQADHAAQEEQAAQADPMSDSKDWGEDAARIRAYNCTSCGAELLCDDSTAAVSCPYCGNNTVIPSQFDGKDRPDYVIPFKVDKKDAVEALKKYYKGRILLPGSFSSNNHIEEIKGVYVPFWMFSGEVESSMEFDAEKIQKTRSGDTETTVTEHYSVLRDGRMRFSRIPVDASTKMPDDLMDSIEPYDYKELKPFRMEYMPGYLANKYDVSKEECRKRADQRAIHSTHDAIRNSVKGYDRLNTRTHSDKVNCEAVDYGLLPVWLLNTKWDGKDFLFAMNGQSGTMTGDLPVSKGKLYGIAAAVFAMIFLLMNFLVLKQKGDSVLISGFIALVVAAITAVVMNSKMKPVAKSSTASGYASKDAGLQILSHNDRYIRREQSSRQIQKSSSGGQKPEGGPKPGGGPKPSGGPQKKGGKK